MQSNLAIKDCRDFESPPNRTISHHRLYIGTKNYTRFYEIVSRETNSMNEQSKASKTQPIYEEISEISEDQYYCIP
jgi:hypothetical protein